jgi:stromal membrane-associated protein
LAPGHVPSEAYVPLSDNMVSCPLTLIRKIENFIRTKYESKRWVMDGGMPDPATLDTEANDDVVRSRARQRLCSN